MRRLDDQEQRAVAGGRCSACVPVDRRPLNPQLQGGGAADEGGRYAEFLSPRPPRPLAPAFFVR